MAHNAPKMSALRKETVSECQSVLFVVFESRGRQRQTEKDAGLAYRKLMGKYGKQSVSKRLSLYSKLSILDRLYYADMYSTDLLAQSTLRVIKKTSAK